MASNDTIREVLASMKTSFEALTPTTDSSETYKVITARDAGLGDDIPNKMQHRAIVIRRVSSEILKHFVSTAVVRQLVVTVQLFHVWKREKLLEAETVRAEDVHQLQEDMEITRPGAPASGESYGVQIWNLEDEDVDGDANRWRTTLTFSGQVKLAKI